MRKGGVENELTALRVGTTGSYGRTNNSGSEINDESSESDPESDHVGEGNRLERLDILVDGDVVFLLDFRGLAFHFVILIPRG